MKFETMKHHNNTVDNFGRRFISRHGALVLYSIWVYVEPGIYDMRQEIMYTGHINALYNKQDAVCVLFTIETILKFIKKILPNITRVMLQSNNVRFYQNTIVQFFIS